MCGPGGPAAVQEDDEDPFTWGLPRGHYVPDPFLVGRIGVLAAQADFRASIECDILPDGSSIRLLVLTNARGRVESSAPAPGGGTVAISAGIIRVTEEERTNPRWTLRVYRWDAKWDQKELEWKSKTGQWASEGRIEVRFREPFRAFQVKQDFYFLTDSGSLYRAPANAKAGTSRKMHLVHDGKARPIKASVSDAGTGRSFLFVGPAKPGGKPAFFEMAKEVALEEYDPKELPEAKGAGPHGPTLRLARFLHARKLVK